jgi:hypothetical protein
LEAATAILDHIIPVNEEHLRRLIRDYVGYHQEDRIHDSLGKDTPKSTRDRAQANDGCRSDFLAVPGRPPPSLHVETSGIETVAGDAAIISLVLRHQNVTTE